MTVQEHAFRETANLFAEVGRESYRKYSKNWLQNLLNPAKKRNSLMLRTRGLILQDPRPHFLHKSRKIH